MRVKQTSKRAQQVSYTSSSSSDSNDNNGWLIFINNIQKLVKKIIFLLNFYTFKSKKIIYLII